MPSFKYVFHVRIVIASRCNKTSGIKLASGHDQIERLLINIIVTVIATSDIAELLDIPKTWLTKSKSPSRLRGIFQEGERQRE